MTAKIKTIDKQNMGVVLFGGTELLIEIALHLRNENIDVSVITSPRQAEETVSHLGTLKSALERQKLNHYVTKNLTDDILDQATKNFDSFLGISLGAAWLFDKATIYQYFNTKLYNIHPGGLPENRGAGGFSWQILMGERIGYFSCHRVNETIDKGKVVFSSEFIYPQDCYKPIHYWQHYKEQVVKGLLRNLKNLLCDKFEDEAAQPEHLSTYWPRLNSKEQAWIDWNWSAKEISHFISAFDDPYDGAKSLWNTKTVHLKDARLIESKYHFHPFQFGLIFRKHNDWIMVAAKSGSILIKSIIDGAGSSVSESLTVGDRLYTTHQQLDAKNYRPFYSSTGLQVKT